MKTFKTELQAKKILLHLKVFCIALLLLSFQNCGCSHKSDKEREFWVINYARYSISYNEYDPSVWYQINAEKRLESAYSIIYVDENQDNISDDAVQSLADEFDNIIYPRVTGYFAQPLDVDSNGKVIIIIFDIIDNYSSTGEYVGGYFYYGDLWRNTASNPHSNTGEIVYVDCYPSVIPNDGKRGLAHEFQHLVNLSNAIRMGKTYATDTWIDEGLSESAEHACYGQNADRIEYYNNYSTSHDMNQYPLFYWNSSLVNYVKSYLFFQYLRVQAAQNWNINKLILNSSYSDYRAIEYAMSQDSNLSTWTFDKLLLRWYATNNGVVTGSSIYSYNGEIDSLTPNLYTGTSVTLQSGGGVVRQASSVNTYNSTGYIYLSVDADGSPEDFSGAAGNDYFVAVYKNGGSTENSSASTLLPILSGTDIAATATYKTVKSSGVVFDFSGESSEKPRRIDISFPRPDIDRLKNLK